MPGSNQTDSYCFMLVRRSRRNAKKRSAASGPPTIPKVPFTMADKLKVEQGIAALASRFAGNRPKSQMVRTPFRNAGYKNYMERVSRMPSAKQASYSVGAPQFNEGKPIVIRHREYLQPIVEVTSFTGAGRYIIQPALVDNFPWLGQIAGAFENYLFTDIKYVFRNRVGTNANATVYTATQYDVSDPEFSSVEEIMTYAGARSEVVWKDFAVDANLRQGRAYKKYLTRTAALPSGQDYQPYDSALFTICCVGGSAGAYVGDLLVEYTIQLWNPKQNPNLLGAFGVNSLFALASGTVAGATPFLGYNSNKTSNFTPSNEPVVDETKNTITFPQAGAYDIAYHLHSMGGSQSTSGTLVASDSKSVVTMIEAASAAGGGFQWWAKVAVSVGGAVLTYTGAVSAPVAGAIQGMLYIAVEALDQVLNFQGKSPVLSITDGQLDNMRRHWPKYDLSSFIKANERWRQREAKRQALPPPASESEDALDQQDEILYVQPPKRLEARDHMRSVSSERKGK